MAQHPHATHAIVIALASAAGLVFLGGKEVEDAGMMGILVGVGSYAYMHIFGHSLPIL